jgi:hypothetical protein
LLVLLEPPDEGRSPVHRHGDDVAPACRPRQRCRAPKRPYPALSFAAGNCPSTCARMSERTQASRVTCVLPEARRTARTLGSIRQGARRRRERPLRGRRRYGPP